MDLAPGFRNCLARELLRAHKFCVLETILKRLHFAWQHRPTNNFHIKLKSYATKISCLRTTFKSETSAPMPPSPQEDQLLFCKQNAFKRQKRNKKKTTKHEESQRQPTAVSWPQMRPVTTAGWWLWSQEPTIGVAFNGSQRGVGLVVLPSTSFYIPERTWMAKVLADAAFSNPCFQIYVSAMLYMQ